MQKNPETWSEWFAAVTRGEWAVLGVVILFLVAVVFWAKGRRSEGQR